MEKFKLSENFINKYKRRKAPFGFNGLGELVYMRTYSRIKEDGKNERWWETVQRVVEALVDRRKGQTVLVTNVKGPLHFVDVEIGQADFSHYVHPHKDIDRLQSVY